MRFSTKAIHIGQEPEKESGAVVPPVYLTTTYAQKSPGKFTHDYTRALNPSFDRLEPTLAALENAKYAVVFSSGIGATTAILSTLKSGDRVIATDDLYGGTYRLLEQGFKQFGLRLGLINTQDINETVRALKKKPQLFFIESPTNPQLKITDIRAVTRLSKKYNVRTVVDNTFASPYFQNPITLGADVVLQSTSKYIAGHLDVIGGAVMTNENDFYQQMIFARKAYGLNPSPFDVWLTSRGVKTLALRMEKHQENAIAVAKFLENNSKVKKVYYPGLPRHQGYSIARRQMRGFSGMVTVDFRLTLAETKKVITSFKIFTLAESLGGVRSLVDHPASMTHFMVPEKEQIKMGVTSSLVRISVGIEDKEDLISDLKQALAKV